MRFIASSSLIVVVSLSTVSGAFATPADQPISAELFASTTLFQSGSPAGLPSTFGADLGAGLLTSLDFNVQDTTTGGTTPPPANGVAGAGQGAAASGSGTNAAAVDEWEFRLTPYLWLSAMRGSASVKGLSSDINVTIDDILRNLDDINFAGGAHFEASKDKWTIFGDAMYLSIGGERWYPNGVKLGLNFEQGLFEVGGAYDVVDIPVGENTDMRFRFEPLAGVRVYTLYSELTRIDIADHRSRTDAWVDVMGGGRAAFSLTKDLDFYGRFDVGGAPNSLSWNAIVGMNWRFCNWAGLEVGWRWLSIDKTSERGSPFEYDVLEYGPFMGVEFRF
ncbi:MAG: hypothetical protein U0572_07420 [Phycisphaerales bacterium]